MSTETSSEGAARAAEVTRRVVDELGIEATLAVHEDGDEIRISIEGEDVGILIGRHGATIDAVQHLAFRAARMAGDERRVVVDAAGYRSRREEILKRIGERAAREALRFGRAVELEPMRASERRVIHEHLREFGGVETRSEGEEPDRRLVVEPTRRRPRGGRGRDRS
ncbi:protein jag [Thermoleophilum album]|uniref:SpoIIIJ-associated protein n=1 Tax=Thermoleophilum album TaxID=29539 RepID=A0A1H6FMU1_THEAL|nr:R3H domain-containing nucleic acid-binding protein [Thermoleophilum album]SEH11105.1 spoIIIJ-associated protein [Thermoleophilum album]